MDAKKGLIPFTSEMRKYLKTQMELKSLRRADFFSQEHKIDSASMSRLCGGQRKFISESAWAFIQQRLGPASDESMAKPSALETLRVFIEANSRETLARETGLCTKSISRFMNRRAVGSRVTDVLTAYAQKLNEAEQTLKVIERTVPAPNLGVIKPARAARSLIQAAPAAPELDYERELWKILERKEELLLRLQARQPGTVLNGKRQHG